MNPGVHSGDDESMTLQSYMDRMWSQHLRDVDLLRGEIHTSVQTHRDEVNAIFTERDRRYSTAQQMALDRIQAVQNDLETTKSRVDQNEGASRGRNQYSAGLIGFLSVLVVAVGVVLNLIIYYLTSK